MGTRRRLLSIALGSALLAALAAAADAAAPAGRYTVTVLTVHDTRTRLTWQRAAPIATYTWSEAKAYCASAAVAVELGGAGRVPTKKELVTLVDYSVPTPGPTIDSAAFPGTPGGSFWSMSSSPGARGGVWYVDFSTGHAISYATAPTAYVRCVR